MYKAVSRDISNAFKLSTRLKASLDETRTKLSNIVAKHRGFMDAAKST